MHSSCSNGAYLGNPKTGINIDFEICDAKIIIKNIIKWLNKFLQNNFWRKEMEYQVLQFIEACQNFNQSMVFYNILC